jgi:hypothetical protein
VPVVVRPLDGWLVGCCGLLLVRAAVSSWLIVDGFPGLAGQTVQFLGDFHLVPHSVIPPSDRAQYVLPVRESL